MKRAVRMGAEDPRSARFGVGSDPVVAVCPGVGCAETVRKEWVRQAQVVPAWPGTTTKNHAELKRLRRDNAELREGGERI